MIEPLTSQARFSGGLKVPRPNGVNSGGEPTRKVLCVISQWTNIIRYLKGERGTYATRYY